MLVAGDFVRTGGMDAANYALAAYLARCGAEVHLVGYRAADDLTDYPNVLLHRVPKPLGSYTLGEPLLDSVGRYWGGRIGASNGRVLVNGGNCRWGDINWVHYVHDAYTPANQAEMLRRMKYRLAHRQSVGRERRALQQARVVITNSERTKADVVERLRVPPDRVRTVYYGVEADKFRPATLEERVATRARLGWPAEQPVAVFVGALGDRRKGFDTLFSAWRTLCADPSWDANLAVVGSGDELHRWRERARQAGLEARIHFLGFRADVPNILAGCDVLVAPTRYEAYGLGVQEALCCGMPALVTRTAGIAERYPAALEHLLISDPNDPRDLVRRMHAWRARADEYRAAVAPFAADLRSHTWDHMSAQMIQAFEDNE